MKTKIIVRGVRLWPLQWGYVARVSIRGCTNLFRILAGYLAMVLLVPSSLDVAKDPILMHAYQSLYAALPPYLLRLIPMAAVIFYVVDEVGDFFDIFRPITRAQPINIVRTLFLVIFLSLMVAASTVAIGWNP